MGNSRRRFITTAAALATALPVLRAGPAQAVNEVLDPLIAKLTGGARLQPGRVKLEIPRLADNGHSVPLKVAVEASADPANHVRRIILLSERNPRPLMAIFHLSPKCGRSEVVTRVRLNGTQRVFALGEFADGSYWYASAEVEVTESACLDLT